MQKLTSSDITGWVNNAPPAELFTVVKQALSRIGTLPPDERDQFAQEISNDPTVAKLFKTHA